MTKAFLIVSVACNVWFLFLLFYDRIMDTMLKPFPIRLATIVTFS